MKRLRPGDVAALEVFAWSRLALWGAAIAALLVFVPGGRPRGVEREDPNVISDLGFATDVWARWDSYWFIQIARDGYGVQEQAAAFYPGYPALLAVVGRALAGHYVPAGIVVSLLASAAAFVLLQRLAEQLVGADAAFRSVLFLAFFPTTFFLSAVYSEALFLLLAVAMFLLAERGRLYEAAVLAGLAWLTRPTGLALLPALAVFALRDRGPWRSLPVLLVPPALFAVFPVVLRAQTGEALRFLHVETQWDRSLSPYGPLEGVYRGAQAAWAGVRQLLQGSDERWFWVQESADRVAVMNIELFALLVLFSVLTVVAWRRLGAPYGLFAASSLALPLAVPTQAYPLLSLSRFGVVVFPLFIALALLASTPRRAALVTGTSAILLGVHLTQWALWQWVA
jgi:Mannosyltransferase (PIG-V)